MKLHYYPDTDSLYIELKSGPGTETRQIAEGLAVDLDEHGDAVGLDIDRASRRLDLSKVETVSLPPATAADESFAKGRFERANPLARGQRQRRDAPLRR